MAAFFADLRYGEKFAWGELLYMKIPAAPVGECEYCGIGVNALTIGRRDGRQLTDRRGYPMLPWGTHFCPGEQVDAARS